MFWLWWWYRIKQANEFLKSSNTLGHPLFSSNFLTVTPKPTKLGRIFTLSRTSRTSFMPIWLNGISRRISQVFIIWTPLEYLNSLIFFLKSCSFFPILVFHWHHYSLWNSRKKLKTFAFLKIGDPVLFIVKHYESKAVPSVSRLCSPVICQLRPPPASFPEKFAAHSVTLLF